MDTDQKVGYDPFSHKLCPPNMKKTVLAARWGTVDYVIMWGGI